MGLAAAFKSLRGKKRKKEEEKRTKISQEPPLCQRLYRQTVVRGPRGKSGAVE